MDTQCLYVDTRPCAAGEEGHADVPLPPIELIVEHFAAGDPKRQEELDYCLRRNAANPLIDRVHVLAERRPPLAEWGLDEPRLRVVDRQARLTFAECFAYVQQQVAAGTICLVANADIFFDDTLALLKLQDMAGRAFALLRWEQLGDGCLELHGTNHRAPMYHPNVLRGGCQDAWVFQVPLPPLRDRADFFVGGVHLCDSKVNWVLHNAGLEVTNPCYSLRAVHVHRSQVRHTVRDAYCSEPPFFCPAPCHLPVRWTVARSAAARSSLR